MTAPSRHSSVHASLLLMKQLIAGVILLLVVGLGAFLYRNILEHPATSLPGGGQIACTQEAKLCPDGTSVGRTGPTCDFALCVFPNVEDRAIQLSYLVPAGYAANTNTTGTDDSLRAVFEKPAKGQVPHTITIRRFSIDAGKTATDTMVSHTTYEPSGNQAKALSEFKKNTIQGKTFYCVTLERFEGQIHTACYLPRTSDVLRFEVLEKDVDWTNQKLNVDTLPEHQAFYNMLTTVSTS